MYFILTFYRVSLFYISFQAHVSQDIGASLPKKYDMKQAKKVRIFIHILHVFKLDLCIDNKLNSSIELLLLHCMEQIMFPSNI